MCPASERSASDPVHQPPAASTTAKAMVASAATRSGAPARVRSACACSWWWWCSATQLLQRTQRLLDTRAAPRHHLVGADQREVGPIELAQRVVLEIDDLEIGRFH